MSIVEDRISQLYGEINILLAQDENKRVVMKQTRNCNAVVNGTFCECGGAMNAADSVLMSNPPQRKMTCPFCGETEIILDKDSGTSIQFIAIE